MRDRRAEAVPLAQPATVRVALTEPPRRAAPLLVAEAEDEFEAENLTVEIVEMPQPEAYAAMARGEVDAVVGTVDAPFLDAVHDGSGARLVLGGPLARAPGDTEVPQAGLWARDRGAARPRPLEVGGGPGRGGQRRPRQRGALPDRPGARPGGADPQRGRHRARRPRPRPPSAWWDARSSMAWLPEPEAAAVAGDDALMLLGTLPASEAIEGTVFGPRLLGADRAVGLAYVRAVLRTINTYLADGWSDEAVAAVADATGEPPRTVRRPRAAVRLGGPGRHHHPHPGGPGGGGRHRLRAPAGGRRGGRPQPLPGGVGAGLRPGGPRTTGSPRPRRPRAASPRPGAGRCRP